MTVVFSVPEKLQGRRQAAITIWVRAGVNGSMMNFQKKQQAVQVRFKRGKEQKED